MAESLPHGHRPKRKPVIYIRVTNAWLSTCVINQTILLASRIVWLEWQLPVFRKAIKSFFYIFFFLKRIFYTVFYIWPHKSVNRKRRKLKVFFRSVPRGDLHVIGQSDTRVHKLNPNNRNRLSWVTRLLTRFMNDGYTSTIFGPADWLQSLALNIKLSIVKWLKMVMASDIIERWKASA